MNENGLFPYIPAPHGAEAPTVTLEHCGDGNYLSVYEDIKKEDYVTYLAILEEAGYIKYADNGEGLGGAVFTATYIKHKWQITVTYIHKQKKMYLSVCFDKPLSECLIYKEDYLAGNQPGAKTKLHMLELWYFGNSFVIQLKNGHFIISDGGWHDDAAYLLDYLEALVPEGEKPVVEAWLISHAHIDHCGVFRELWGEHAERILVNGIYYHFIEEGLYVNEQSSWVNLAFMKWSCTRFRDERGEQTRIYRPHTGQRLYFSDVTVDVIHTHDQLLHELASGDINESSTWYMLTMEGQKCLLTGDGEKGCMKTLMATFDSEYLNVDMMTLMHHGFNTRNSFTDFCKVKTLLLTVRDRLPVCQANENDYLKEQVEEYVAWGDGAKVFTFPYTVGSYETLCKQKWIYHDEAKREEQGNLRRYWRVVHKDKEIRTLRIQDNGHVEARKRLLDKIQEHLPPRLTDEGMMIELRILPDGAEDKPYTIVFQELIGWVISGKNEDDLYMAIDRFIGDAKWSDKGFIANEVQ